MTRIPTLVVMANPPALAGGCSVFQRKQFNIKRQTFIVSTLLVFLVSLCVFKYYQYMTIKVEPQEWWRVFIFGIPAMLIVFFVINAERSGCIINRFLVKIGDASYSIYLSHILTINVVGRIWSIFSVNEIYDNIIMIPLILIITIGVGFISYIIIEKPLLSMMRKIV